MLNIFTKFINIFKDKPKTKDIPKEKSPKEQKQYLAKTIDNMALSNVLAIVQKSIIENTRKLRKGKKANYTNEELSSIQCFRDVFMKKLQKSINNTSAIHEEDAITVQKQLEESFKNLLNKLHKNDLSKVLKACNKKILNPELAKILQDEYNNKSKTKIHITTSNTAKKTSPNATVHVSGLGGTTALNQLTPLDTVPNARVNYFNIINKEAKTLSALESLSPIPNFIPTKPSASKVKKIAVREIS